MAKHYRCKGVAPIITFTATSEEEAGKLYTEFVKKNSVAFTVEDVTDQIIENDKTEQDIGG